MAILQDLFGDTEGFWGEGLVCRWGGGCQGPVVHAPRCAGEVHQERWYAVADIDIDEIDLSRVVLHRRASGDGGSSLEGLL